MNIEHLIALLKANQQTFLIWVVIFFGSIVHATNAVRMVRKKWEHITFIDLVILLIISSFAGFLFSLWPLAFWLNIYWVMIFAWMWAYLWINWLNIISKTFLEWIVSYLNKKKWIDIKIDKYEK